MGRPEREARAAKASSTRPAFDAAGLPPVLAAIGWRRFAKYSPDDWRGQAGVRGVRPRNRIPCAGRDGNARVVGLERLSEDGAAPCHQRGRGWGPQANFLEPEPRAARAKEVPSHPSFQTHAGLKGIESSSNEPAPAGAFGFGGNCNGGASAEMIRTRTLWRFSFL